jgi:predicted alpha/beta-hydrolase family hydrolase
MAETAAPTFLGGLSYGGRQATMLAAADAEVATGLLLLSYPLHPPGRAEAQRTQHFPSLSSPALFVHGTRDPFGTITELRAALNRIPASTSLVEVAGAGHDLGGGRRVGSTNVVALVVDAFFRFFALR